MDEKILALSIWKQTPKGYRFLRSSLEYTLPSITSVRGILAKIRIHAGPIGVLTKLLTQTVEKMSETDKKCVLVWDEISLKSHIDYDPIRSELIGLEDNGVGNPLKFADHALVFLIRGIRSGYKLPVAYYFVDSVTSTLRLKHYIKKIHKYVIDCGLDVCAFVCDQASTNVAAINKMKSETARERWRKGKNHFGMYKSSKYHVLFLYPKIIKHYPC